MNALLDTTLCGHSYAAEFLLGAWDCCESLAVDTASRGADARGGTLIAPEVPGLGVEPLAALLGEPVGFTCEDHPDPRLLRRFPGCDYFPQCDAGREYRIVK